MAKKIELIKLKIDLEGLKDFKSLSREITKLDKSTKKSKGTFKSLAQSIREVTKFTPKTISQFRQKEKVLRKFGARALDHFGRITEPKKLTADNAWRNRRDWGDNTRFYAYNRITKEERPITEQQYYDNSFTLNQ